MAYYEEPLLEMRQSDVLLVRGGEGTLVPAVEWTSRLRHRLIAMHIEPSVIEATLPAFREHYREIMPGAVDGKGQCADGQRLHASTSRGGLQRR